MNETMRKLAEKALIALGAGAASLAASNVITTMLHKGDPTAVTVDPVVEPAKVEVTTEPNTEAKEG